MMKYIEANIELQVGKLKKENRLATETQKCDFSQKKTKLSEMATQG